MNDNQDTPQREEHDFETDVYVSDCNRLPDFFRWPKALTNDPNEPPGRFPLLGCLIVVGFFFGLGWVLYRLALAVMGLFS